MNRRPALDGLRAIAVGMVVIYHSTFGSGWLPGGFVGVDVFFVISGYLITALLIAEHDSTGRISLREFYGRRVVRLLPALLVTIVGVAVLQLFAGPVPGAAPLWQTAVEALLYVVNWVQIVHPVATGYLGHTWSLSVEEQFYLVWPALLLLAIRRRITRGQLGMVAVMAIVVVCAARTIAVAHRPPVAGQYVLYYEATFFRADSLLSGILVACLFAALRDRGFRLPRAVMPRTLIRLVNGLAPWLAAALVGLLVTLVRTRSAFLYREGETVIALLAAVVVAHAAMGGPSLFNRVLGAAPLRGVGRISYAIYLFHVPVVLVVLEHTTWSPWTRLAVVSSASVALAAASWWLVERPAQRLRRHLVPARRPLPPLLAEPAQR